MKSFTFDEQSVDRIATSVRWVEGQTVRQARRENPTTLGSTFGHLLYVQVQGSVAENAFGTALVYEGAAGAETPGTEDVHFVNKSGRDLAANDDVWLCWPRIAGDHSGEAQAYWYSLSVGGDSVRQEVASFVCRGEAVTQPIVRWQNGSFGSPDITLSDDYTISLATDAFYLAHYNIRVTADEIPAYFFGVSNEQTNSAIMQASGRIVTYGIVEEPSQTGFQEETIPYWYGGRGAGAVDPGVAVTLTPEVVSVSGTVVTRGNTLQIAFEQFSPGLAQNENEYEAEEWHHQGDMVVHRITNS